MQLPLNTEVCIPLHCFQLEGSHKHPEAIHDYERNLQD